MNTERIKEIQKETAYPDSISVQQALLKVWNECTQGKVVNKNDLLPDVSNRRELLIAFADAINVCDGDKRKIRKLVDIYLKKQLIVANGRQYEIVLDYEARTCQATKTMIREPIFNNRIKPSMFYIACCE